MQPLDVYEVPLSALHEYPGNPRRGDIEAIAASLETNGQFQPLVVQAETNVVLSGNHTLQAMRLLGWESCLVRSVPVDDAGARKIVLAANRTFDLGTFDDSALLALLSQVEPADLDGTGYDLAFLDALAGRQPEVEPYGDDEIEVMKTGSGFTHDASRTQDARRLIVLDMPSPLYAWVVQSLDVVRARHGLASIPDALGHMLAGQYPVLPSAPKPLA